MLSTTERTSEPSYAGHRNSRVSVSAIVSVPGPASRPGFPDGDRTNLSQYADLGKKINPTAINLKTCDLMCDFKGVMNWEIKIPLVTVL